MSDVIIPSWTLGECIRKARTTADLDRDELAARLHVSASLVAKWESGTREPRPSMLALIEDVCGVPPRWIISNATLVIPSPGWFTADDLAARRWDRVLAAAS